MRIQGLITAAAFAAATFSVNVQAIDVGSIASSRFDPPIPWTLDGNEMTETRAKLLNPANFGPEGTVQETINITDLNGQITYSSLTAFDVFLIGFIPDDNDNDLTPGELSAMQEWVAAGGTMIITCDSPDNDDVCSAFGPVPSIEDADPPVNPTPAGSIRPPFNGPFGAPTELNMAGLRKYFSDTGGFQVLAEDQLGNPVILEALFGQGRVVILSDVDMISDDTLSPAAGISNDNDRFLANLVTYLANEAIDTFFINPGLNGNWWDFTRSGEGAQLEVIINGEVFSVLLTFYSYDTENNQIFLVALGDIDGNTSELDVFITDGGLWGPDFDPGLVQESPFGTGTLTAISCEEISLVITPNETYLDLGFVAHQWNMGKLAQNPALPCPLEAN